MKKNILIILLTFLTIFESFGSQTLGQSSTDISDDYFDDEPIQRIYSNPNISLRPHSHFVDGNLRK